MTRQELFKNLIADLKPARRYLVLGLLFYVPVTVLNVIQPLLIGYTVQHGMLLKDKHNLIFYVAIFFFVIGAQAICELVQGLSLQNAGQTFVMNLRTQAFKKTQRLSIGFLDTMPMGRILTRLTNDMDSVMEMFSTGAVQILGDCLFLIGTFIMLFAIDIQLTLYSFMIVPLLVVGIALFRYCTKRTYVRARHALSSLNSSVQEYLAGMATVQTSNQVESVRTTVNERNADFLESNQRAMVLNAVLMSFVDAVSYIATALVLWGAFQLKLEHALALGVLVAFLEALSRFFQPILELSNRSAIFQSALVSLERIYELLLWPEEHDKRASISTPLFLSGIQFKNVSFAYLNNESVLNNVSFTLNKGERVALVGPTGAGKSTVIKLLNRFYTANTGEILIDGKNINDLPLGATRSLISVVPQEGFLFNASLRDNLGFGNSFANDDDLWRALEVVQLRETIEQKGGLNEIVLQHGHNFSLGERQLLAIARALVMDPPILILDEATASIDSPTETRLQNAIKELLSRKTALVIAHRLTTILDADRVIVFMKGTIVEEGSHQILMARNGIYASLIRAHIARFDLKTPRP